MENNNVKTYLKYMVLGLCVESLKSLKLLPSHVLYFRYLLRPLSHADVVSR